jgi:hypothetical protein
MTIRRAAQSVAVAAGIGAATAISVLAVSGTAGAAAPAYGLGQQVPGTAVAVSPFTPGTPFSSGQSITVKVPANSTFTQGEGIFIVECNAPNGVLPTNPSACDTNTNDGNSVSPAADGSITATDYQVYSLPSASFGEGPGNPTICDLSDQCVLYIGTSTEDFTQPHIFSQAFVVNPTPFDSGANPGDGTPEFPLAIGLPIAAAGILAGSAVYRRRRSARAS